MRNLVKANASSPVNAYGIFFDLPGKAFEPDICNGSQLEWRGPFHSTQIPVISVGT